MMFILRVIRDNNAPMNRDEILTALFIFFLYNKNKQQEEV